MSDLEEAEFDWKPPTDAEMKVLQARRERQDKISKIMGEYLLKGYKMLGTVCGTCENILMQDKQGKVYCIACNELDSDAIKDDPALSSEAAKRQEEEQNQRSVFAEEDTEFESLQLDSDLVGATGTQTLESSLPSQPALASIRGAPRAPLSPEIMTQNPLEPPQGMNGVKHKGMKGASSTSAQHKDEPVVMISKLWDMSEPLMAVHTKLQWASSELQTTTSVERSVKLCKLIKKCAKTLEALEKVHLKIE